MDSSGPSWGGKPRGRGQASAKRILYPPPQSSPGRHSPPKILPLLSSADAESNASLGGVCSDEEFGKDPPKETPFRPSLLAASFKSSVYLPARSWFVVFDKLNITVYYQAYPNKIKRQPGDTDYLTSRCTYKTRRRHESRNRPARCHARLGGSGGTLSPLRLRLSLPPGSAQPQVSDAWATGINKEINKSNALWGNGGGGHQPQIETRSICLGRGRASFGEGRWEPTSAHGLEKNRVGGGWGGALESRSLAGGKSLLII